MLIHLTGVLCHLFKFFSSYQVLHLFSTGVLSEFVLPCSLFISFQPQWFRFLLVHCARHSQLCNLQGSNGVPCFYFSTAVLSIVFNSVVFFLSTFQPLKVLWFHSLVEEATQFYLFSSSSVCLRCHPRSRDEILLQWWSVVTSRDRRSRRLPCFACRLCYLFVCCIHHVIICIASALRCRHVLKICIHQQLPRSPLSSLTVPRPTVFSVPSCQTN